FSSGARFDVFFRRRTGCSASLLRKGRRGKGEAEGDERGGYKALHGVFSILGSFSGTLLLSVSLHGGNPPKETRKLLIPNYSLVRVARCKSFNLCATVLLLQILHSIFLVVEHGCAKWLLSIHSNMGYRDDYRVL